MQILISKENYKIILKWQLINEIKIHKDVKQNGRIRKKYEKNPKRYSLYMKFTQTTEMWKK